MWAIEDSPRPKGGLSCGGAIIVNPATPASHTHWLNLRRAASAAASTTTVLTAAHIDD